MRQIAQLFDTLNEYLGRGIAWFSTALVLLIGYDVTMRYLFNETYVFINELEWHFYAIIFLLGIGFAYKHDRHVRVDVFYHRFSAKAKAWVNLLGTLFFLFPFCWVLCDAAFSFAMNSWQIGESSPDPGGLPARYVIKFVIFVGALSLFIQGISVFLKSLLILLGQEVHQETAQS